MPIGAAIGVGVLGAGATVASSKSNSKAINKSTAAQSESNAASVALQRDIYGQNKSALTPYMNTGTAAGANLNALLGLGTAAQSTEANNDFREYISNSDYGFKFGEGANALNSGFAGAGTLQSGAAMKELEKYRQDLQSGYRGEYMSLLGNQQGVGLSGASALAGVGQGYANNITALNSANANAITQAAVAKANNNNAMISGLGNALGSSVGILQGAGKL